MRAAVPRAFGEDHAFETVPDPDCAEDGGVLKVLSCAPPGVAVVTDFAA